MRCALILLGALALLPARSLAQESGDDRADLAAARALFEQGAERYAADDLEGAEDLFRRSLALREVASVQYNLATVLERLGQLVEARELFLRVARDESVAEGVQLAARSASEGIEPRLARLVVRVVNGPAEQVTLGERRLDPAVLGVAVPVDPGLHSLRGVTADGRVATAEVDLAPGGEGEATLTFVPQVVLEETEDPVAPPASDDGWIYGVIFGVVGAVLLGVGIGLGVFLEQDRYFSGTLGAGRVSLP